MDDIQKRLKETSEACVASYEKWAGNKKDGAKRESLQEAIHELRKVSSRLEIELAISERDEAAMKKIPIPAHRAAGKEQRAQGDNDSHGNSANGNNGPKPQRSRKPKRAS